MAQDPDNEGYVAVTVTYPDGLFDIPSSHEFRYEVACKVAEYEDSLVATDEDDHLTFLVPWTVGLGNKKTPFTVTPVAYYDDVEVARGKTTTVNYDATKFVEAQWKQAPTMTAVDSTLGKAIV